MIEAMTMPEKPMPTVDIPTAFVAELSAYNIGDKLNGELIVEVVGKRENSVDLRVTSMALNTAKRV